MFVRNKIARLCHFQELILLSAYAICSMIFKVVEMEKGMSVGNSTVVDVQRSLSQR